MASPDLALLVIPAGEWASLCGKAGAQSRRSETIAGTNDLTDSSRVRATR